MEVLAEFNESQVEIPEEVVKGVRNLICEVKFSRLVLGLSRLSPSYVKE